MSRSQPLRAMLLEGLAWNASYQVVAAVLQFATMLVVVRIIAPEEYGHWAVALGILQALNSFGVASFVAQALQLQADEEPDWTLHWYAGSMIQVSLFLACNATAIVLAMLPHYRAVSPLLAIASIGLLLDGPARLRTVMLQRRLQFRRLRVVTMVSSLLSMLVIVSGAMAGYGAKALILGGNVVIALPALVDLLMVQRWRPSGHWIEWPELRRYRSSLAFGGTRIGSSLLATSRGALGAGVLPSTLGFEAIGLMNRAEGLFTISFGRLVTLLSETSYPVLPQVAGDAPRFARIARAYSLVMVTPALAGAAFLAACGPDLSRLLYGAKWAAADPLLLPGAVLGVGAALSLVGGQLMLAQNRIKAGLGLDVVVRILMLPAFSGVVFLGWSTVSFFWVLAIASLVGGFVCFRQADRSLAYRSLAGVLVGPAVAGAVAAAAAMAIVRVMPAASAVARLAVGASAFAVAWCLVLRIAFPSTLQELLAMSPIRRVAVDHPETSVMESTAGRAPESGRGDVDAAKGA